MSNHTPGPWTVDPEGEYCLCIEGGDGSIVCDVRKEVDGPLCEANAHRIVACVNACEGLNPEAIADAIGALTWLLDDMSDAGEDKNPETGEVYDSVANARKALAAVKGAAHE
jgi:hypothetical protein